MTDDVSAKIIEEVMGEEYVKRFGKKSLLLEKVISLSRAATIAEITAIINSWASSYGIMEWDSTLALKAKLTEQERANG